MQTQVNSAAFNGASDQRGELPASRLITLLVVASIAVVLLGLVREVYVYQFGLETVLRGVRQLSLDNERNLGSWYSSGLMSLAAILLFMNGRVAFASGVKGAFNWYLLAVVFLLMSFDETAGVREDLVDPLRESLQVGGFFYFAWVIPAFFIVGGLAIYLIPFLLSLPRRTAAGMFIAGALYVLGAIGMEMIAASYFAVSGWQSFEYQVAAFIEESMEIAGLTLFVAVLIRHLLNTQRVWKIS